MRIRQDARFVEERARFALRFCCEHCALFDPLRERCAHDYPTADHRLARYEDRAAEIVFCKDFQAT
jgi:hypothetical protein